MKITEQMTKAGVRALHDTIGYQYNGHAEDVVDAIIDAVVPLMEGAHAAPSNDGSYEVLPLLSDASGEAVLSASYTANNGIRISIQNLGEEEDGIDANWRDFDFTAEQALQIGEALIRWAKARAALKQD